VELYDHSSNTPLFRGAQIKRKAQAQLYPYLTSPTPALHESNKHYIIMTLISVFCDAGEPHSMTVDVPVMEKPGVELERLDI
jgi:hypothetical protein